MLTLNHRNNQWVSRLTWYALRLASLLIDPASCPTRAGCGVPTRALKPGRFARAGQSSILVALSQEIRLPIVIMAGHSAHLSVRDSQWPVCEVLERQAHTSGLYVVGLDFGHVLVLYTVYPNCFIVLVHQDLWRLNHIGFCWWLLTGLNDQLAICLYDIVTGPAILWVFYRSDPSRPNISTHPR